MIRTVGRRNGAAWALLVLVMIIPGLVIHRWWSRINAETRKQMSLKVRKHLPEGDALFAGRLERNKLSNPMSSTGSAVHLQDAVGVTSAVKTKAVGTAALRQTNGAVSSATPTVDIARQTPVVEVTAPAVPVAHLEDATGAAGKEALRPAVPAAHLEDATGAAGKEALRPAVPVAHLEDATGAAGNSPGTTPPDIQQGLRDPMLSPFDVVRLEEIRFRKAAGQSKSGLGSKKSAPAPSIDKMIWLQGIISVAKNPNKAIVNGKMVGEGDFVGKVKVLRITYRNVVFEHNNKKFVKSIPR